MPRRATSPRSIAMREYIQGPSSPFSGQGGSPSPWGPVGLTQTQTRNPPAVGAIPGTPYGPPAPPAPFASSSLWGTAPAQSMWLSGSYQAEPTAAGSASQQAAALATSRSSQEQELIRRMYAQMGSPYRR